MTLKEFPPHLKTIVPAAAAHAAVDFPVLKGIGYPYEMQWHTLTSGKPANWNLFEEQPSGLGNSASCTSTICPSKNSIAWWATPRPHFRLGSNT